MLRPGLAITVLLLALGGCNDKNCQSTCRHIYDPSECDLGPDGMTPERAIDQCIDECESALSAAGDLCVEGDEGKECYDPYVKFPGTEEKPPLENEKQVALWMECVWEKAPTMGAKNGCDELHPQTGGFCAPI